MTGQHPSATLASVDLCAGIPHHRPNEAAPDDKRVKPPATCAPTSPPTNPRTGSRHHRLTEAPLNQRAKLACLHSAFPEPTSAEPLRDHCAKRASNEPRAGRAHHRPIEAPRSQAAKLARNWPRAGVPHHVTAEAAPDDHRVELAGPQDAEAPRHLRANLTPPQHSRRPHPTNGPRFPKLAPHPRSSQS